MADHTSVISRSSFVRGRVTGSGNLEIQGRVEGDVDVSGDLTIDTHGMVASSLNARRLVIRGAVKGDLTASDAIILESGARVVGDLNAPRVAIAEGALVRGHVQTGAGGGSGNKSKSVGFARPAATAATTPTPKREERGPASSHAASAPAAAKKAPPPPPARIESAKTGLPRGSVLAGSKPIAKAPAPIVPVLKKGAKATQKKRG